MKNRAKPAKRKTPRKSASGRKMRVIPDFSGTGTISDEVIERWLSSLPRARELARVKR
jgi:hypothetical protein